MDLTLRYLTDDQTIIELCNRYWEMDADGQFAYKVNDLILPAGIHSRTVSAFVAEHCRVCNPEIACPDCGRPHLFASRSEYQQRRSWRFQWQCDDCRQVEADCKHAAQQAAEKARRLQIQQHYGTVRPIPLDPYKELSFKTAVALLALLRIGASEDLSVINPIGEANGLYAPTEELATDLLRLLYRNKCIYVHPSSSPNAFAEDVQTFYLFRVAWVPPVDESHDPRGVLEAIESIFRKRTWPKEWFDEILLFWRELALHECLQYLQVCMVEHGFEFNPGEKTKQVLSGALENYTVAQLYVFIYRAVKDAAAYMVSNRVSKKQAANSTIGRIQRQAERALAEGWEIKPYRRDWRAPESMVGHVLYRVALKVGDSGINYTPSHILHDSPVVDGEADSNQLDRTE